MPLTWETSLEEQKRVTPSPKHTKHNWKQNGGVDFSLPNTRKSSGCYFETQNVLFSAYKFQGSGNTCIVGFVFFEISMYCHGLWNPDMTQL